MVVLELRRSRYDTVDGDILNLIMDVQRSQYAYCAWDIVGDIFIDRIFTQQHLVRRRSRAAFLVSNSPCSSVITCAVPFIT